jgi:aspartyl protease family protein
MIGPSGKRPPILFFLLIAGIVAAVIVLILRHRYGTTFGLANDDFARLAILVAVLIFVGAGVLGRAMRPGEVVRGVAFWAMLIAAVGGGYANRDRLAGVAGRLLGALAPGVPISAQLAEDGEPDSVVIVRSGDGHFAVRAEVEGKPMALLLDTGASFVTLTYTDAHSIGIDTEALDFGTPIRTANGTMNAASVTIDRLAVGPIERHAVKALVAPRGALEQGLLGMSFLDTLKSYAISGDRLVMRP